MHANSHRLSESDRIGTQRVVARSFLFVYFPAILLLALGVNFIWEAVRVNVSSGSRDSWPLRFTLLDTSTTASLFALTTGLLLARLQWAYANRPSIGYAIDDEGANFKPDSPEWRVWIHNGGPGTATVEHFQYIVKFVDQSTSIPITLFELNQAMTSRGLVDGVDYFIRQHGKGAPYAPTTHYTEGSKICRFTIKALAKLVEFDIVVRVKDGLGDIHERTLFIIDRLPSVAKTTVNEYRNRSL